MSDRHWLLITDITGPVGFCLSIFSNSLLLTLMFQKSSPITGTYKNLLIVFCVFTIFYSSVEMFLRPLIHIYDDTLYLIYRKRFDTSPTVSHFLPTIYCGCYAMSFNLFALQFVFRYVATCKPQFLVHFNGRRFFYWLFGIVFLAATWQASSFIFFPKSERTQKSFEFLIKESYDLESDGTDYVPYKYFYFGDDGVKRVNMLSFTGILQHGMVIVLSFGSLFYCGVRTFLKIRNHSGMSQRTRSLQLQLFRALVAQTFIPMIFMYIPIGFMFACPYLDLQLGAVTNYQTVMAQLYPGVDPFVLLFLIDSYRNTILGVITRKRFHNKVTFNPPPSRITTTTVF